MIPGLIDCQSEVVGWLGWIRRLFAAESAASGSVDRPAGGREEVVECIRFGPRDDVRRSIDQHISVYLYDDHTVYRI